MTIVPDGYTYAEKATMVSHANALVAYLRSKTPYKEHDPFINYILVYAYSGESGTDQCDCGIVRNTAMSTGFPNAGYPCGDGGNPLRRVRWSACCLLRRQRFRHRCRGP